MIISYHIYFFNMIAIMKCILSIYNPLIYNINHNHINNSIYTLEHIFPKSYMNKKTYNDMHNIFKCNKEINNYRSNYKFSDFNYINNINYNDFKKITGTDNYLSIKNKIK